MEGLLRPMVRPHLSASAVGEAQDLCAGSEEYMPFMRTSSICPKGIPPAVNERHLFPRGGKKSSFEETRPYFANQSVDI